MDKAKKKVAKLLETSAGSYEPSSEYPIDKAKLSPGVYRLAFNPRSNEPVFVEMNTNHDSVIDLPNEEYNLVIRQIEHFFTLECKAAFESFGFLYKRSALLYGLPGTGKTCLVNRIAEYGVKHNSVVLFNPDVRLLPNALEILEDLQPETTVIVIFEEFDSLLRVYESELLNVLDGEIQKNNIIYLATTNYIDKIPARIMRPGRFSNIVEVKYPSAEVRKHYLTLKLKDHKTEAEIDAWVDMTVNFSIDELKETVLSSMCLKEDLKETIARIVASKTLTTGIGSSYPLNDDDDDNEDDLDYITPTGLLGTKLTE